MSRIRWGAALVLGLGSAGAAFSAGTKYVDDDTCPRTGAGTYSSPYCKIQTAICALKTAGGGTVRVRPGTYRESLRMFPGISVVSTAGSAVTTIDASGQPCTLATCTASADNLTCSAVVWGSGATSTDRLEGFRITGGAGILRDFGVDGQAVAGGGIFVFNSSPTITRNEISGNQLFSKSTANFWGAGIYLGGGTDMAPARPVITNNVIHGNVATPTLGVQAPAAAQFPEAVGGGIYAGLWTAPVIRANVIADNVAGDATTWNGVGGGIASYAIARGGGPEIDGNVIRGNTSQSMGGGLFFGVVLDEAGLDVPTRGRVDSNVVDLNSSLAGGGLAIHVSQAVVANNTIVDNHSEVGGGVTLEGAGPGPWLSSNIVAFNEAVAPAPGPAGGGVAVFANPQAFRNNDVFDNVPDDIGGLKTSSEVLGLQGNVGFDPQFVSRVAGARDLRLDPGSPLIDGGDDALAGTLDLDGRPRRRDGDGDGRATVDVGAFEYQADRDGDGTLDWTDNCASIANATQANTDHDTLGDVCDPDDDNDHVTDARDCAPLSATLVERPHEVGASLRLDQRGAAVLSWRTAWQGRVSNVYRAALPTDGTREPPTLACLVAGLVAATAEDATTPAPGSAFLYLVSSANGCGEGPLGSSLGPTVPCSIAPRDSDRDGRFDLEDNCPSTPNALQADADLDQIGDACDPCAQRYGICATSTSGEPGDDAPPSETDPVELEPLGDPSGDPAP